jgi:hypothetical protein
MVMPKSAYIHRTVLTDVDGEQTEGVNQVALLVWDTGTLAWIKQGPISGGIGGGGAVTIADGADIAEGTTTDAAVYGDTAGTVSAKLRGLNAMAKGIGTANAPTYANVTDTDSVVLAANSSRKKMVIVNTGIVNVHFGDGATAVDGRGIVLTPNGTWVMDNYTFTTAAIHAVCASASTLSIQEYQ